MQKEKRNLQDLAGVYVYNATERDSLDRPNEGLITEFSCIEGNAMNCSFCIADQSLSDTHAGLLPCSRFVYNTSRKFEIVQLDGLLIPYDSCYKTETQTLYYLY